ncbi:MAG: class I SAM-dependent methyltransferase [Acidobacteria bacterium]|nr:class I SAM-dependent methyltransferase [Acidobacteriota bacterium]
MPEPDSETLGYTGERMVPEKADSVTFWEHIYRYRFAAEFVRGKRVLDIACGEGYGTSALLRAGAASVVGVDICEESCAHAHCKYGVDIQRADAEGMPFLDHSFDIVVSFETIEHVQNLAVFLDECVRVLLPGGLLVLSTPNRDVYSEKGKHNPFHHDELDERELVALLTTRFKKWQLYSQRPKQVPWWSIYSLAGAQSPWLRIRGGWRLRKLLQTVLCPHLRGDVDEQYRRLPVEAILGEDRPFSSVVNGYSVRRWEQWKGEKPYYFIAVARV